jgi:nucleotide-binding universal stress UspA family protein
VKLILAATDGSEGADRAVAAASDFVKSINAKLLIVNVSNEFFHTEIHQLDQLRVTEGDVLEELSRSILSRAKVVAQDHGAVNIETIVADGDPATVLMNIANRKHADAIVVGRRGRGRLEGLLIGSVSQKLASLAHCVVMIVP